MPALLSKAMFVAGLALAAASPAVAGGYGHESSYGAGGESYSRSTSVSEYSDFAGGYAVRPYDERYDRDRSSRSVSVSDYSSDFDATSDAGGGPYRPGYAQAFAPGAAYASDGEVRAFYWAQYQPGRAAQIAPACPQHGGEVVLKCVYRAYARAYSGGYAPVSYGAGYGDVGVDVGMLDGGVGVIPSGGGGGGYVIVGGGGYGGGFASAGARSAAFASASASASASVSSRVSFSGGGRSGGGYGGGKSHGGGGCGACGGGKH